MCFMPAATSKGQTCPKAPNLATILLNTAWCAQLGELEWQSPSLHTVATLRADPPQYQMHINDAKAAICEGRVAVLIIDTGAPSVSRAC